MKRVLSHLLLSFVCIPAAFAVEVSTTADAGSGSLRGAIEFAVSGTTITFAPALDSSTIALTSGPLIIERDVSIDGSTLPGGITIDASMSPSSHRVFEVRASTTAVLDSLTITGGRTPDGFDGVIGIQTDGGNGGGILNAGDLMLNRCTISGNSTGDGGAGVPGSQFDPSGKTGSSGGRGGGIYNDATGTLVLINCTVAGNSTGIGGSGGSGFDDFDRPGPGGDGGPGGAGGGIYSLDGASVTLTHSTVSANRTGAGGAGGEGGAQIPAAIDGPAGSGAGLGDRGNLALRNTIISGNKLAPRTGLKAEGPDLAKSSGSFTENGVNFIGEPSGSTVELGGNILNGNAKLSPLGDYGGPTQTMRPSADSRVVDAAGPTALAIDQRGRVRAISGHSGGVALPDIGAAEYDPAIDPGINPNSPWYADADGDGLSFGVEQLIGTDPSVADRGSESEFRALYLPGPDQVFITFALDPTANDGTLAVVQRSVDLIRFTTIYTYNGSSGEETEAPGVSAARTEESVLIFDSNPPSPQAYYRLVAEEL